MTFTKLVYLNCRDLEELENLLNNKNFSDQISKHIDSADENEIWVELNSDVLQCLVSNKYITVQESEEIQKHDTDTILFY